MLFELPHSFSITKAPILEEEEDRRLCSAGSFLSPVIALPWLPETSQYTAAHLSERAADLRGPKRQSAGSETFRNPAAAFC